MTFEGLFEKTRGIHPVRSNDKYHEEIASVIAIYPSVPTRAALAVIAQHSLCQMPPSLAEMFHCGAL
jgi:hypothetical protein